MKNKQEKKYPKPEEVEAKDKIMYLANQWCKMDENGDRGAMIMLSDRGGTHYMFIGKEEMNTRAAIDILTSEDMNHAGRAVQIAFLKAMLFVKFDKAQERAGLNVWEIKDKRELKEAIDKLPEYWEIIEKTAKLDEELEKICQGK